MKCCKLEELNNKKNNQISRMKISRREFKQMEAIFYAASSGQNS